MIDLNHIEVKGKLHDLSLHIQEHEFVWIHGPNGAGKKTVLDVCTGFCGIDAGTIRIMGYTKLNDRHYRQCIDYLDPYGYWDDHKTIVQNMWIKTSPEKTASVFQAVGLEPEPKLLSACSNEQKCQVMLARALIKPAKILFLYEWLQGLDDQASQRMMKRLYRVYESHRLTIVFASCQVWGSQRRIDLDHGYVVKDQHA